MSHRRVVPLLLALSACTGEAADPAGGDAVTPGEAFVTPDLDAPAPGIPSPLAEAPTAEVEWWRQVGSTSIDHAAALAVDGEGGLVVAGEIRETVDFGGRSLSALGAGDAFVARYAPDGTLSWVVGLGSRLWSDNAEATDVAVGPDGSVAVTGTFEGTLEAVTPPGEPGPRPVAISGASDVFVVSIDPTGTPLWARSFGSEQFDQGGGVAIDATGHVVIAAEVGYATQVASIDRSGELLWSRRLGHISTSYSNLGAVQAVAVDAAGDLFLTGSFTGSTDLGGGELRSAGGGDVFVAKLRGSDGSHVWSRRFGSALSVIAEIDDGWDVVVTPGGDVVVGGDFNGALDFGGGPVEARRAGYVACYRGDDGAYLWARVLDGEGMDSVATLTTTAGGEVLAAASFTRGLRAGTFAASGSGFALVRLAADDGRPLAVSTIAAAAGAGSPSVAVAPDDRAFVSLDFYGDVDAGGARWSSSGFSDFVLGRTRTP